MTTPLERAQALVARAVHAETPVEEARSSALLACREIAKRGLLESQSNGDLEAKVLALELRVLAQNQEIERARAKASPPMRRKRRGTRVPQVQRTLSADEAREFIGDVPANWAEIDRTKK